MKSPRFVVVAGPTGSGKTGLALSLAASLDGEIVGCDSVQVYRGFDIGSAKATKEEMAAVPHHLIDVVDWDQEFDAGDYAARADLALAAILSRERVPIVTGGTGLYLRALLRQAFHEDLPNDAALRAELGKNETAELFERLVELDPHRAGQVHRNDRVRVLRSLELVILLGKPLHTATQREVTGRRDEAYVIILEPPRPRLLESIVGRTKAMLRAGILEETSALLARGVLETAKPMQSIGYKQCCDVLAGRLGMAGLEDAIVIATRQYSKRQGTWFRRVDSDLRLSSWDLGEVSASVRALLH